MTRLRSRANPARPHIWRLSIVKVDVALDGAGAAGQGEPGGYGVLVVANADAVSSAQSELNPYLVPLCNYLGALIAKVGRSPARDFALDVLTERVRQEEDGWPDQLGTQQERAGRGKLAGILTPTCACLDRKHQVEAAGSTCRQPLRHRPQSAAVLAPQTAATPALPRTGRIADRTRYQHADVRRMLADGRSFREIAADLGRSQILTLREFSSEQRLRLWVSSASPCAFERAEPGETRS
jgi:hypothetical protein